MKIVELIRRTWPKVKLVLTMQLVGSVLSILCAVCSGCATGYLADRGRDAADIFTATIGAGLGAKARVGPVQVGALVNSDMWGLRGGQCGKLWIDHSKTQNEDWLYPWRIHDNCGQERVIYGPAPDAPSTRHKGFLAKASLPVIGVADQPEYYSQVDIIIGCIMSLRLGFNPGELLDFILGWTTIDIYGDDLNKKKSNHTSEGIRQPADGSPKPST